MARPLAIFAEDKLTEAVLQKCVAEYLPDHTVIRSDVACGRGNVKKSLAAYANLASSMPVIIGVDLDHDPCPPQLLSDWDVAGFNNANLIVRVAVREVEAWVLADKKRFANFVGGTSDHIPSSPDEIEDPKRLLLEFARATASDDLKRDLIPINFGQYPRIGPAYNLRMCKFVRDRWRPHVAGGRSASLARAIRALESLRA